MRLAPGGAAAERRAGPGSSWLSGRGRQPGGRRGAGRPWRRAPLPAALAAGLSRSPGWTRAAAGSARARAPGRRALGVWHAAGPGPLAERVVRPELRGGGGEAGATAAGRGRAGECGRRRQEALG